MAQSHEGARRPSDSSLEVLSIQYISAIDTDSARHVGNTNPQFTDIQGQFGEQIRVVQNSCYLNADKAFPEAFFRAMTQFGSEPGGIQPLHLCGMLISRARPAIRRERLRLVRHAGMRVSVLSSSSARPLATSPSRAAPLLLISHVGVFRDAPIPVGCARQPMGRMCREPTPPKRRSERKHLCERKESSASV